MTTATEYRIRLRRPHPRQAEFVDSDAKRIIIRAGRRGGKTVGVAIKAVKAFLAGHRILYAAPTVEQTEAFWQEVRMALVEPVAAGVFRKNESLRLIELPGSEQRIRAKTSWNADTLRGDFCDLLIIDEWQLCDEDMWGQVGAPMLLDTNGDAIFVYTPPSLHSRSISKARDPRHAAKMFKVAQADTTGRWAAFHFTSHDNPHISEQALAEITQDMTSLAHRQEILAEDIEVVPGALWAPGLFRYEKPPENLERIVVAIDPAGKSDATSNETGLLVVGRIKGRYFVLADLSGRYTPDGWGRKAIAALADYKADRIVAEVNNGGEMVEHVLRTIDPSVPYTPVTATRGKAIRAEPVAALYEQGKVFHARPFPMLEEQLCSWSPEMSRSPDRLDALVWGITAIMQAMGPTKVVSAHKTSLWGER